VLASLETAPELSGSLRREIQLNTSRLLPPSSINKAKAIASAGAFVLDLLADCQPRTIDEVTATIRAMAETRLEEALPVIARFASDPRSRVFQEVLRCMAYFDVREYGEAVLAKSTATAVVRRTEHVQPGWYPDRQLRHDDSRPRWFLRSPYLLYERRNPRCA
jgi:hypothetical protein